MSRSPSSSGLLLPLPGSPASSWALYRARLGGLLRRLSRSLAGGRAAVVVSFWLFGLINNVLYVVILSAAQDLVGSAVPKGVVLLADVVPSFATKLVAPYVIHRVPYAARVLGFVALSTAGMLLLATARADAPLAVRLLGVVLASLSSGAGELSFLGLTHYYGTASLAAWGSGTGAAGLVGAGLYVVLTDWWAFSVRASLLASAVLPAVMLASFFLLLPRGVLLEHQRKMGGSAAGSSASSATRVLDSDTDDDNDDNVAHENERLVAEVAPTYAATEEASLYYTSGGPASATSLSVNLRRARALFVPYMLPLLLVYVAEYTINQGVAPTLLFPLAQTPFRAFREFYPVYGFLYQLGVFVSRSSTPFLRVRRLYWPCALQVANLALLVAQALFTETAVLPSVYLVFAVIFWEGLLGGAVYVNTFAAIMERVPAADREFSLGATSVSDSGGICLAGFLGMALEVGLCNWQVQHGRAWCREMQPSGG